MKKIIIIFIMLVKLGFSETPPNFLISDADYFNTNYTLNQTYKFFNYFKRCLFTKKDIKYIYKQSKKNKVNIILIVSRMEVESSIISNRMRKKRWDYRKSRAMGYGLFVKKKINGKTIRVYQGFQKQIYHSTKAFARYPKKWKSGVKRKLHFGKKTVYPENKSTFSLYMYCPFFGYYMNYGTKCIGNKLYIKIFNRYKKIWEKLNRKR